MQITKGKSGPITIKGAWDLVRRTAKENLIKVGLPSLKEYARGQAERSETSDPVVRDARRWLEAKRPGGTDAERAARREKRKEQRAIRSMKSSSATGGSGKRKK